MTVIRDFLSIVHLAFSPSRDETLTADRRFMRPFMWMVFPALVILYALTIYYERMLQEPLRFVTFTLLMVLHALLHFVLLRTGSAFRQVVLYMLLQGVVALGAALLGGNVSLVYGLFFGLIGETVGMFGRTPRGLFALLFNLTLSASAYLLVSEFRTFWLWAATSLPVVAFLLLYVYVFRRSIDEAERYRALLQKLETANQQLSAYAAQVEDLTIASERQRMARELHDTLSQGLAGLILQLEAADAHLAGGRVGRVQAILKETMVRARSTLADARRAIDDLRQAGHPDLETTARREADHFVQATGIPCSLDLLIGMPIPLPVEETAIRVIQEALTNVARHAQAETVGMRIVTNRDSNHLEIKISDDGIGFDPQAVEAGHYGLLGMRERVRLAGGNLELDTKPGKGTELVIRFPLEEFDDGTHPRPGR